MNHGPVELVRLITTGTDPGDLIRLLYTRQWWARIWKRFWRASMRTTLRWAVRASLSLSKSTVVRLSRRTVRLCGTASGFLISLSIQKIRRFSSWGCFSNQILYLLDFDSKTGHSFDWCCFYYFLRNSLVALLEALFARLCLSVSFCLSLCLSVYLSICHKVRISLWSLFCLSRSWYPSLPIAPP